MVVKCLKASLVTVKAGISTSSPSRWLKSESEGRYDQRDREAPDHAGVGWKPHAEAWKRRFVWVWKLVGIGRFMKALEWGDWEAR